MRPTMVVLQFLGSAAVVVLAGTQLARAGDVIAARTRLGGVWVGALLLAGATSLPELATDIAAVRLGEVDLAAGDLFGSSLANMLILALVSLLPGVALFARAGPDHGLAAALAIALTAIAAAATMLDLQEGVLGLGAGSLLLGAAYVVGMRALFERSRTVRASVSEAETVAEGPGDEGMTLRAASIRFALAALAILVAAPAFAASARDVAALTGLGTSFVGTLLVGFATSLPELATTLAAARLGAFDIAIANLYGSNAFNMALFAPLDLAHGGAPILGAIEQAHAMTALVAIVMMALGLWAILAGSRRAPRSAEPVSLLMVLVYALGAGLLYLRSRAP